jgi:hypothetical protein
MSFPAPAEPSCATPAYPTLAPTYAPELPPGEPNASYSPAVPSGIVPEPTPDPTAYYPTQPSTADSGGPTNKQKSQTWTTIKPRNAGTKDGSSSTAGALPSLASLWSK